MKIGEYIKRYRKENKITMDELAKRSGISKAYISLLEKNEHPLTKKEIMPSFDVLKKIAKGTHISFDELINIIDKDTDIALNSELAVAHITLPIPLYSHVSCGLGMFIDDYIEDYVAIPDRLIKPHKEYFACVSKGDSMINKGIQDGDILVFEKTSSLKSGDIGCFCVDENMAVCKIYRQLNNGLILLESANDKYPPIEVDVMNNCFKIIGKYICRFTI